MSTDASGLMSLLEASTLQAAKSTEPGSKMDVAKPKAVESKVAAEQQAQQQWKSLFLDNNQQYIFDAVNELKELSSRKFAELINCANKNQAEACFDLACFYFYGIKSLGKPDYKNAFKYLMVAVQQNLPVAHWVLYEYFVDDAVRKVVTDIPQDQNLRDTFAFNAIKNAAKANLLAAQHELAELYSRDDKISFLPKEERDLKYRKEQCFYWCKLAADSEYGPALYNLGVCYEENYGVPEKDQANRKTLAKACFELAAKQGITEPVSGQDKDKAKVNKNKTRGKRKSKIRTKSRAKAKNKSKATEKSKPKEKRKDRSKKIPVDPRMEQIRVHEENARIANEKTKEIDDRITKILEEHPEIIINGEIPAGMGHSDMDITAYQPMGVSENIIRIKFTPAPAEFSDSSFYVGFDSVPSTSATNKQGSGLNGITIPESNNSNSSSNCNNSNNGNNSSSNSSSSLNVNLTLPQMNPTQQLMALSAPETPVPMAIKAAENGQISPKKLVADEIIQDKFKQLVAQFQKNKETSTEMNLKRSIIIKQDMEISTLVQSIDKQSDTLQALTAQFEAVKKELATLEQSMSDKSEFNDGFKNLVKDTPPLDIEKQKKKEAELITHLKAAKKLQEDQLDTCEHIQDHFKARPADDEAQQKETYLELVKAFMNKSQKIRSQTAKLDAQIMKQKKCQKSKTQTMGALSSQTFLPLLGSTLAGAKRKADELSSQSLVATQPTPVQQLPTSQTSPPQPENEPDSNKHQDKKQKTA